MRSHFTLLLIALLAFVLGMPIAAAAPYGLALQALLGWGALTAAVWTVESRRARVIAFLLAGLALTADALIWATHATPLLPLPRILIAVALGFVTCVILDHVLTREEVTFDVVLGGVCTYLLLGASFAQVYAVFEILAPGSLLQQGGPLGSVGPTDLARGHIVEVSYYSFVTLTTLGYGDIVPTAPMVRAVSTVEALIGQIFPAILIAHLVSLRATRGPVRRGRGAEHGSR